MKKLFTKIISVTFVLLFSMQSQTKACDASFAWYASPSNADSIHFYATGSNFSGQYWSFGDGTTSTSANPWHIYSGPGTYVACRTINDSGVYCTFCDTIIIGGTIPAPCNAHFGYYPLGTNPSYIHLYAVMANAQAYVWIFGDGTTNGSGSNTWHYYSAPGTYHVCLYVNDSGTWCSYCDSITVLPTSSCYSHFAHYSLSNPDSVHFYPTGTNGAIGYLWHFGDGTTSNQQYPWHYYTSAGTYQVCLTVAYPGAVYCTWCDSITIPGITPPPCNSQFSFYYLNNPDSLHFYGFSNPFNYWSFGDGTTSTQQYPWHYYSTPGTYYVCHYVSNGSGVYCMTCDSIIIGTSSSNFQMAPPQGGGNDFVFDENTTGINAINGELENAILFPNPANDVATIFLSNIANSVTIKIYDIDSKIIYQRNNLRDGIYEINTLKILSGLYFYSITDNGLIINSGRIMVIH